MQLAIQGPGESYAQLRDALLSELLASNASEQSFVDFNAAGASGLNSITPAKMLLKQHARFGDGVLA